MKQFHFQLHTVLDYKQQVLNSLMVEHGALLAQVRRQEEALEAARQRYRACNAEFTAKKLSGLTVSEALRYEGGLAALEAEAQRQQALLARLQAQAEEKHLAVVAAKQEASSLEKLRERKAESHQQTARREEEALIDELVLSARSSADNA